MPRLSLIAKAQRQAPLVLIKRTRTRAFYSYDVRSVEKRKERFGGETGGMEVGTRHRRRWARNLQAVDLGTLVASQDPVRPRHYRAPKKKEKKEEEKVQRRMSTWIHERSARDKKLVQNTVTCSASSWQSALVDCNLGKVIDVEGRDVSSSNILLTECRGRWDDAPT